VENGAGLTIGKQSVPLGVIGIIYWNLAKCDYRIAGAFMLFKSGNAVILKRAGKRKLSTLIKR